MGKYTEMCHSQKEKAITDRNMAIYTECCYRIFCMDIATQIIESAPLTTNIKDAHVYYKQFERVLDALISDHRMYVSESEIAIKVKFQEEVLGIGKKYFSFTILNRDEQFKNQLKKALKYILPIWWNYREKIIRLEDYNNG